MGSFSFSKALIRLANHCPVALACKVWDAETWMGYKQWSLSTFPLIIFHLLSSWKIIKFSNLSLPKSLWAMEPNELMPKHGWSIFFPSWSSDYCCHSSSWLRALSWGQSAQLKSGWDTAGMGLFTAIEIVGNISGLIQITSYCTIGKRRECWPIAEWSCR